MFYWVPIDRSLRPSLRRFVCTIVGLCVLAPAWTATARPANTLQTNGSLRLELPANGNLRVENLRGGVIVGVWHENYVSVSAVSDSGQSSSLPAVIHRSDSLLSIRLARGPVGTPRINLELRIPARAHVAVVTRDGSVDLQGLRAALLAQTVSGAIPVAFPTHPQPS